MVLCGKVKFKRSTKPPNAVEGCIIVCFWDGADPAFGITIYARWKLDTGEFYVYLIAAKARVSPMLGTSTPRVELEASTLCTRVVLRIVHALVDEPIDRIMF